MSANDQIHGRSTLVLGEIHPTAIVHPEARPEYEFHICRVFIDKELKVPIRYAAYGWPLEEGGKPTLEEEYTYLNIQLNVGLTDEDFSPDNSNYDFR